MKRSEMVINIAIELMSRLPEWEKAERLKFASEILQCVEIEGMLPPMNTHSFYLDGDHADPKSIIYRTWDEEQV